MVLSRKGPTKLLCDNNAAIIMENSSKPTERDIHIDVNHFSFQELVELKQSILEHIRTNINVSGTSTKAIVWVLHNRHNFIMMDLYQSELD